MGWFSQGKIAKGNFVQGMQHPRIFGRGHIGRGRTNIAPVLPAELEHGCLPSLLGMVKNCNGVRREKIFCTRATRAAKAEQKSLLPARTNHRRKDPFQKRKDKRSDIALETKPKCFGIVPEFVLLITDCFDLVQNLFSWTWT
jgi:hypothetical protein